jgi:hypothetical protein
MASLGVWWAFLASLYDLIARASRVVWDLKRPRAAKALGHRSGVRWSVATRPWVPGTSAFLAALRSAVVPCFGLITSS